MEFGIQDIGKKRRYSFLREERYRFQGLANENHVEMGIEVNLLSVSNGIPTFKINIFRYKQSNSEGAYRWVGDIHEIRNELICTLNENGQLGSILNIDDIRSKWQTIKPELMKSHKREEHKNIFITGISELLDDQEKFSASMRFAQPYLLLFPGIHNKMFKKDEPFKGYRELPNFLAAENVPIITKETLSELSDGKYQVEVKGEIDEEHFEQDKVTAMIRILKNRPRVPTKLELGYMERYRLDEWPWSEQSMCMSIAEIPGTLYREEKNILKAI
ncbi:MULTISPECIES: hypothetical protein [Chryseobacterium]|uniref:Uncharacterized protein n=1 Tax=Chryseobacterium rhizosphaerae TaxID=395937 RepID=A0AAE4C0E1_9FLAO|nr:MULTISPECIES: hypothetical protein [Chryseobacterium]MBL3549162.1 hypothetical protein [Chryseobacterium sp. KMC2]MDR6525316.1 hypothetical protein [Chryseobacterium rhizosphaerae]